MATEKKTRKKRDRLIPNEVGRPTVYRPDYAEKAYKLCLLGATDEEIADILGVTVQCLYAWKSRHVEFMEAIKAGKAEADAEIAQALYHRAKGYSHPEDDIRTCGQEIVITPTVKHYPPDTQAASLWLRNRQPNKWRDKVEIDARVTTHEASLDDLI